MPERLKQDEAIHFFEYLHDVLTVGMSVHQAVMKYKPPKPHLSERFRRALSYLGTGIGFARSLEKAGLVDESIAAVLENAEMTGVLGQTSKTIAEQMKQQQRFKAQLRKAMTMPIIEAVVALLVAVLAFYKIIPNVGKEILKVGTVPPMSMKIIEFSFFFRDHFFEIVSITVTSVVALYYVYKDRIKLIALKMPILGDYYRYSFCANFFYKCEVLLRGGMHFFDVLRRIQRQVSPQEAKIIKDIYEYMRSGYSVFDAFSRGKSLFPQDVLTMLEVASAGSGLVGLMQRLKESCYAKAIERGERIVLIVEPLVITLLGILVAVLVISVYYPIFSLSAKI